MQTNLTGSQIHPAVPQNQPPRLHESDKTFARVQAVVSCNGLTLLSLSPELKERREIVLTAVKNTPQAIEFASDALKQDSDFLLDCVRAKPGDWAAILSLANVNHHIGDPDRQGFPLIKDRKFLKSLIHITPQGYICADPELKADSDIMLNTMDLALTLQGISKYARLEILESLPSNFLLRLRHSGNLEGVLLSRESVSFVVEPSMQPEDILKQIATQLNEYELFQDSKVFPEQIKLVNSEQGVTIVIRPKEEVLRQLLPLLSNKTLKTEIENSLPPHNPLLGG